MPIKWHARTDEKSTVKTEKTVNNKESNTIKRKVNWYPIQAVWSHWRYEHIGQLWVMQISISPWMIIMFLLSVCNCPLLSMGEIDFRLKKKLMMHWAIYLYDKLLWASADYSNLRNIQFARWCNCSTDWVNGQLLQMDGVSYGNSNTGHT